MWGWAFWSRTLIVERMHRSMWVCGCTEAHPQMENAWPACHSATSGHSKLAPGLAHAILQPQGEGLAYVTIATECNPQGEIRGELAERCPC